MDKKMVDALHIAKSILDYCQGDAWERECTSESRVKFDKLYYEIFPITEKKEEDKVLYIYCEECNKRLSSLTIQSHLNGNKHKRKVKSNKLFEEYKKICTYRNNNYDTCDLIDSSKACKKINCMESHRWATKNEETKI